MALLNPISGQAVKNNGSTILKGGNVTSTTVNTLSLDETFYQGVSNHPYLAVSAASSGNVGTKKAISSGSFGKLTAGQWNVRLLGTTVAGVATSVLKSGASDFGNRHPIHSLETSRRMDITSWNYATGAATKGVNAGAVVSYASDDAAHPTMAVPGALTFAIGKAVPSATNYAAKTSY